MTYFINEDQTQGQYYVYQLATIAEIVDLWIFRLEFLLNATSYCTFGSTV